MKMIFNFIEYFVCVFFQSIFMIKFECIQKIKDVFIQYKNLQFVVCDQFSYDWFDEIFFKSEGIESVFVFDIVFMWGNRFDFCVNIKKM